MFDSLHSYLPFTLFLLYYMCKENYPIMMYKKVFSREEIAGYENHYNRWPKDMKEITLDEYFARKSLYSWQYVDSKQPTEKFEGISYSTAHLEFGEWYGEVFGSIAAETREGEWKFFKFGDSSKLDNWRIATFGKDG